LEKGDSFFINILRIYLNSSPSYNLIRSAACGKYAGWCGKNP